jgi:hypothetical protein
MCLRRTPSTDTQPVHVAEGMDGLKSVCDCLFPEFYYDVNLSNAEKADKDILKVSRESAYVLAKPGNRKLIEIIDILTTMCYSLCTTSAPYLWSRMKGKISE